MTRRIPKNEWKQEKITVSFPFNALSREMRRNAMVAGLKEIMALAAKTQNVHPGGPSSVAEEQRRYAAPPLGRQPRPPRVDD